MKTFCLVVALSSLPSMALAQTCTSAQLSDTTCDCGCGTVDSACPPGRFVNCQASHCAAGTVPWEHQPNTCMASACGDGWRDDASGEACDDGNALASGGCSADCRTVTAGYVCGPFAQGCRLAPADAGTDAGSSPPDAGSSPPADAGTFTDADAGATTQEMRGGCVGAPGELLALLALAFVRRARRS